MNNPRNAGNALVYPFLSRPGCLLNTARPAPPARRCTHPAGRPSCDLNETPPALLHLLRPAGMTGLISSGSRINAVVLNQLTRRSSVPLKGIQRTQQNQACADVLQVHDQNRCHSL